MSELGVARATSESQPRGGAAAAAAANESAKSCPAGSLATSGGSEALAGACSTRRTSSPSCDVRLGSSGADDAAVADVSASLGGGACSSAGAMPNQLRRASDDLVLRWLGAIELDGEVDMGWSGAEVDEEGKLAVGEVGLRAGEGRGGRRVEEEVLGWSGREMDLVEVEADETDEARSGFLRMLGIRSSAVVVDSVGCGPAASVPLEPPGAW